jgi:cysteine desulfurase/selenocysteine lyase
VSVESLPLDAARIRQDFPILSQTIHDNQPLAFLDSAASTQRPQQVIDAVSHAYQNDYANVHRGIHLLSERATALYEEARERVREFIGAGAASEVIFTAGTTASINLVARSWGDGNVSQDDEILLTLMEHHSNIVPWQQLAERTGCKVRFAPIHDDGRLDMNGFAEMLNDRTRLVGVASTSNVLGTVNPIAEIAALAHGVGAKVLVDAAQSVPHTTTNVQDWGCGLCGI